MKESRLIKYVNTIEVDSNPYNSLKEAKNAIKEQKRKLSEAEKTKTKFRIE